MTACNRELRVWQDAMDLVTSVYEQTQTFPKQEIYGLIGQMRRAAVSIPSNIAEGKSRSTDRDRSVFFCHARGSLLELETQIIIAERLSYMDRKQSQVLIETSSRIGRMLNALIQSIKPPQKRLGT
jgi:four helix bundle protein